MPKPVTELPSLEVKPDPALEKRARRTFTAEDKLRILREADACQRGELGELLRREKLYSGQLIQWRKELESKGVAGLSKTQPGPLAAKTPEQRRIEHLEKENTRLAQELKLAEDCLELQKKALSMREQLKAGSIV